MATSQSPDGSQFSLREIVIFLATAALAFAGVTQTETTGGSLMLALFVAAGLCVVGVAVVAVICRSLFSKEVWQILLVVGLNLVFLLLFAWTAWGQPCDPMQGWP